ncbi:hypothetical protein AB6H17_11160 [Proteus vulgaris]
MNKEYSEKWQERFSFFDKYGSPKTPNLKSLIKNFPLVNVFLLE